MDDLAVFVDLSTLLTDLPAIDNALLARVRAEQDFKKRGLSPSVPAH